MGSTQFSSRDLTGDYDTDSCCRGFAGSQKERNGKSVHVVTLPGQDRQLRHMCVDDLVLEASANLPALLKKIALPPSRLSLQVQGTAYALGDYVIRIGTALVGQHSKGNVIEIEYKPCGFEVPAGDAAGGPGSGASAVVTALLNPVAESVCPNAVPVSTTHGQVEGKGLPSGHDRAVRMYITLLQQCMGIPAEGQTNVSAAGASSDIQVISTARFD
jgi:hypothetical protein